jgi:hypothetical protein
LVILLFNADRILPKNRLYKKARWIGHFFEAHFPGDLHITDVHIKGVFG